MIVLLDYGSDRDQVNDLRFQIRSHVILLVPPIVSASQGVFLVKTKNAFVPVERDNSVNTYSRI